MRIHELKTWVEVYSAVAANEKRVEVRFNDRDYAVGDLLLLAEYDPELLAYTGRSCWRRVTHVLEGGRFGVELLWVALSLEVVEPGDRAHKVGATYVELSDEDRRAIDTDRVFVDTADAASYHEGEQ